jgi:hypothetical protein
MPGSWTAHWSLAFITVAVVSMVGCDWAETKTPSAKDTTVVAQATFDGREGETASGGYQMVRLDEQDLRLVFRKDFSVSDGPDLYVVLSPKSPDEASGENVLDGEAKVVDNLAATSGSQEYDLPDDIDISKFNVVAVHCVKYDHLFAVAKLD